MAADTGEFFAGLLVNPSVGINLDTDIAFNALFTSAAGKPEQQFGNTIVPAEDPDWQDVQSQAMALLARSSDLRVMVVLAMARLHLAGLPGFGEAVHAVRDMIEQRWDDVHPQLDPEDGNDPTLRSNAVTSLGDPLKVLRRLREMPLAMSVRAGQFSWRDIEITTGRMEPDAGQAKQPESVIIGAFKDTSPAVVKGMRDANDMLTADIKSICDQFYKRATMDDVPKLDRLEKMLKDLAATLNRFAPKPVAAEEGNPDGGEQSMGSGSAIETLDEPATASRTGGSAASVTSVSTRQDALKLLDIVCAYYDQYEPSSPLPLLLRRAIRLANMNFIDTLKDLAPGGLDQAKVVAGPDSES